MSPARRRCTAKTLRYKASTSLRGIYEPPRSTPPACSGATAVDGGWAKLPAITISGLQRGCTASRAPHRLSPPAAAPASAERLRLQEFARKRPTARTERGMTQSDLARAAFGTDASADGDTVARSHDRISVYLAGQALPDPKNRKALADALGVPADALVPPPAAATVAREAPSPILQAVPGPARPGAAAARHAAAARAGGQGGDAARRAREGQGRRSRPPAWRVAGLRCRVSAGTAVTTRPCRYAFVSAIAYRRPSAGRR
jgi:transcriptional regulator with XRE-family HTH domain